MKRWSNSMVAGLSITIVVGESYSTDKGDLAPPPLLNVQSAHLEGGGLATITGDVQIDDEGYSVEVTRPTGNDSGSGTATLQDPNFSWHSSNASGVCQTNFVILSPTSAAVGGYLSMNTGVNTGAWNYGFPTYEWNYSQGIANSTGEGSIEFSISRRSAIRFEQFFVQGSASVFFESGFSDGAASLTLMGSGGEMASAIASTFAAVPGANNTDQENLQGEIHVVDPGSFTIVFVAGSHSDGIASNQSYVHTSGGGSASASLSVYECQTITTQPQSQSVEPGQSASFSVQAAGYANPTFTWRKGGTPLDNSMPGVFISSGSYISSLSLSAVDVSDAGAYDVVVTTPYCGNLQSTPAVLWVNGVGQIGDANADGYVNIDDLVTVITSWGLCPSPPRACPGDVNHNGVVDIDDLVIVITNWS